MVVSYDYSSQNRQRRRTNVPPSQAITMAMAVSRCNIEHITRCSMTRASPEVTGCRHWPLGDYSLHIAPGAARATINITIVEHVPTLLAVLMRQYYTVRISQWRRFVAFVKAT